MSAAVLTPRPVSKPSTKGVEPFRWKWTREDLIRLCELGYFDGHRVMLIDGEVLAMSPMNEPHARGVVFTEDVLRAAFGAGFTFRTQMPMDLGKTTDPEPDIAVLAGLPRSQPADPPATALLVIEVADTSLAYDMGDKANLYAAAGIMDYWVVDVLNGRLHILRDPRPDATQRFGHRYFQQKGYWPTDRVSPLAAPSASILVADLLP